MPRNSTSGIRDHSRTFEVLGGFGQIPHHHSHHSRPFEDCIRGDLWRQIPHRPKAFETIRGFTISPEQLPPRQSNFRLAGPMWNLMKLSKFHKIPHRTSNASRMVGPTWNLVLRPKFHQIPHRIALGARCGIWVIAPNSTSFEKHSRWCRCGICTCGKTLKSHDYLA